MAMSIQSAGRERAEINVTPLIDVLLVLLIIFMIILPQQENGIDAAVPQPPRQDAAPAAPSNDVVITVCGGRTVRLNQEQMAMEKLRGRLARVFADHPGHPLFVRAEPGLEFRDVAQVIDLAKGAGLTRIALLTR